MDDFDGKADGVVVSQLFMNTILLPHQHDGYSVFSSRLHCAFHLDCGRLVAAHGVNGDLDHEAPKGISEFGFRNSDFENLSPKRVPKSEIRIPNSEITFIPQRSPELPVLCRRNRSDRNEGRRDGACATRDSLDIPRKIAR